MRFVAKKWSQCFWACLLFASFSAGLLKRVSVALVKFCGGLGIARKQVVNFWWQIGVFCGLWIIFHWEIRIN